MSEERIFKFWHYVDRIERPVVAIEGENGPVVGEFPLDVGEVAIVNFQKHLYQGTDGADGAFFLNFADGSWYYLSDSQDLSFGDPVPFLELTQEPLPFDPDEEPSAPIISIVPNALSQEEGDDGTTVFEFTVSRSGNVNEASSVEVAFAAGDTDAADFGGTLPATQTFDFAAGETVKTVVISVSGDLDVEADETFSLNLQNATGAEISDTENTANGTIVNDDSESPSAITGTESDDIILTSHVSDGVTGGQPSDETDDTIDALGGNDIVSGGGGNDTLEGGGGNDTLIGGDDNDTLRDSDFGNDTLIGGAGNDTLDGGKGDDLLVGGDGADTLEGGVGKDILLGGDDNDVLRGGDSPDILLGEAGDDTLTGGEGNDLLEGGGDNDTLEGENGHDTLDGGAGNDRLTGGNGVDTYVFAGDNGQDRITAFGFGADLIDLRAYGLSSLDDFVIEQSGPDTVIFGYDNVEKTKTGNTITLENVDASALGPEDFILDPNANVILGTDNPDNITGTAGPDVIKALGEKDTVDGGGGDDVIDGGADDDIIDGGTGNDVLAGGGADDTLDGGGGNDTLRGDGGNDKLIGGDGLDTLEGGGGNDELDGGNGVDTYVFAGANGADTITAFANGADLIDLSAYGLSGLNDFVIEQAGDDTVISGYNGEGNNITLKNFQSSDLGPEDFILDPNANVIVGTLGDDTITPGGNSDGVTGGEPSDANDIIKALGGNDTVEGGGGNDVIDGSGGNDTLDGGAGNDALAGGNGSDMLEGGADNDVLRGGGGADTLNGGGGNDVLEGGGLEQADIFAFAGNNGTDTITDFEDGFDRIDFTAYNASSTDDFVIEKSGDDTVISGYDGDGNTITLKKFDPANLGNDDFIFSAAPPAPPELSIAADASAVQAEGDSGATLFTFTVTRTGDTTGESTVEWRAFGSGENPANIEDIVADTETSGLLTFGAGETSKKIVLQVQGDIDVEEDEGFTMTLSNPQNATISQETASGTIQNDDNEFEVITGTGGNDIIIPGFTSFGVTGGEPSDADDTISAVGGNDLVSGGGGADRLSGGSGDDILIGGSGDDIFAFFGDTDDDTITDFVQGEDKIDLSAYPETDFFSIEQRLDRDGNLMIDNYGSRGDTITLPGFGRPLLPDDFIFFSPDLPPVMSIAADASAVQAEGDSGATLFTFTVTRTGDTTGESTVDWTARGSGINPADADDAVAGQLFSGTLTFATGETEQRITIEVQGDIVFERPETFTVELSEPVNAKLGQATATGTILNDDAPPPLVAITDASQAEGNDGTTDLVFTVTRGGDKNQEVTVEYATEDGTATAGTDYTAVSGTLTFEADETEKEVRVPILGDGDAESDENFTVTLSNSSAGTLVRATATGTIENDDVPPANEITGTPGDDTITPEGNSDGVDGAPPSDGPDIINALGGNDTIEGGGGADIFVFATGDGNDIIGTGTNAEEFQPGVDKIDLTNVAAITDFDDLRSFHVYDDQADRGFYIDTDDGYTGNNTIQLSGWDLNEFWGEFSEDDFIFASGNSIYISDVQIEEGNHGNTMDAVFTVSLSTPVNAPVTVDFATEDGTATAGTDYTAVSGTLTFASGETVQEIRVPITGDGAVEPNESFFVNLSNPVNDVIADGQGEATILDDDGSSVDQTATSAGEVFDGTDGDDVLQGGNGDDALSGLEGDDTLSGRGGDDTLDGGSGDDILAGGSGDDTLTGVEDDDMLAGGSGNDVLEGGAGNDTMTGGSGDDQLSGGAGNDALIGGSGNDTFVFRAADGDSGQDTIRLFNADEDTLRFEEYGERLDAFSDLDSNTNGELDEADAHVSVDAGNTVIDLGGQTNGESGGTLTLVGVTGLDPDDMSFS